MSSIPDPPQKVKPESQARRFLRLLDSEAEEFTFQTATDAEPKNKPYPDRLAHSKTLTINALPDLTRRNAEGAAVWVMINEGDGKGRKASNVIRVRAVFADIDKQVTLDKLKAHDPEPHIVVESSPDHYQAYWLVDGLPVDQFEGVQRSIAETFGSDHVIDPCRVMRVPGFLHQKNREKPYRVRIVHKTDLLPYEEKRILQAFPPLGGAKSKARANGSDEWPELPEPFSSEQLDRYRRIFDLRKEYKSASERDFALVGAMHRKGKPPAMAAAWIRGERLAEDDPKGNRADYVWRTVYSVYDNEDEDEEEGRGPEQRHDAPRLQSMAEWCTNFNPPKYEIHGLIQRGCLYTVTARPGHGKTAVFLRIAVHKALGEKLGGRKVNKGNVIYLAGENPDDVQYRCILMADMLGLDINTLPIFFLPSTPDFDECYECVRAKAEELGEVAMVIVDTGPAFQVAWGFESENDNIESGRFAQQMRLFTGLPGRPTTMVLTHPVKNATQDNLLPRGGGAALGAGDGNLTLWASEDRKLTEMYWAGKHRGTDFTPLTFALETGTCDKLVDAEKNSIPSVWANYVSEGQSAKIIRKGKQDDVVLLEVMLNKPDDSVSSWAEELGWFFTSGKAAKSRVQRALQRLQGEGLIHKKGGNWRLTKEGEKSAKIIRTGSGTI